jgi:hypothetical protein
VLTKNTQGTPCVLFHTTLRLQRSTGSSCNSYVDCAAHPLLVSVRSVAFRPSKNSSPAPDSVAAKAVPGVKPLFTATCQLEAQHHTLPTVSATIFLTSITLVLVSIRTACGSNAPAACTCPERMNMIYCTVAYNFITRI